MKSLRGVAQNYHSNYDFFLFLNFAHKQALYSAEYVLSLQPA